MTFWTRNDEELQQPDEDMHQDRERNKIILTGNHNYYCYQNKLEQWASNTAMHKWEGYKHINKVEKDNTLF